MYEPRIRAIADVAYDKVNKGTNKTFSITKSTNHTTIYLVLAKENTALMDKSMHPG